MRANDLPSISVLGVEQSRLDPTQNAAGPEWVHTADELFETYARSNRTTAKGETGCLKEA